ncbi:hypothetical protein [Halobacillus sp. B29]|uniref:hypothetical protein n=1 Tax=Halobacillus sp. B29 TaxID=3457432 RepID=UPI003FCCD6AC
MERKISKTTASQQSSILEDSEIENLEMELEDALSHYDVEYPSEEQMEATIEAIRPLTPVRKQSAFSLGKAEKLLRTAIYEFSNIHSVFWISNLLFFLTGFGFVLLREANPYFTLMLLAPVPFTLGLLEIFRSLNNGMAELELTFKHTLFEIIMAKLLVTGGFNVGLNLLFSLIIPIITDGALIGKLTLYWVTPFSIVAALGFTVACKCKARLSFVVFTLLIWLSFAAVVLSSEEFQQVLQNIHEGYFIVASIFSLGILLYQFQHLRKGRFNYEVDFEPSH